MGSVILRPNASGSLTNLSKYQNTGSNFEKVNDDPPSASEYVYTYSTSIVRDTYNFPNLSELGVIVSVSVYIWVAVYTGSGYAIPILRIGGTNYGSEQAVGSTYTWKNQKWTENPADSTPWECSDLDSAEIGIGLRTLDAGKNINCSNVYILVEYATPSGSGQIIGLGL